MKAIVSGRAEAALLLHDSTLSSIHWHDPQALVLRAPEEARLVLGNSSDLRFVDVSHLDELRAVLEDAVQCALALDIALFLLDSELSQATREKAARELNRMMENPSLCEYVEGILFAAPIPGDADLLGAAEICERVLCNRPLTLARGLLDLQSAIADVVLAWDNLSDEVVSKEERRQQHGSLIGGKWIQACATALAEGRDVSELREVLTLNQTIPQTVFDAWLREIYQVHAARFCAELPDRSSSPTADQLRHDQAPVQRLRQQLPAADSPDFVGWRSCWQEVFTWDFVEALQDRLFVYFPGAEHAERRDEVVGEVLRYFYSEGVYHDAATDSAGILSFVSNVAHCAMTKVLREQPSGEPIDIGRVITEEPYCGRHVNDPWNRRLSNWLASLSYDLCTVIWARRLNAGYAVVADVLAKPQAALQYIWNEIQRTMCRGRIE